MDGSWMTNTKKKFSHRDIDGHARMVLVLLNEKPLSRKDIKDQMRRIGLRFGTYEAIVEDLEKPKATEEITEIADTIEEQIDFLLTHHFIKEEEELFHLTEEGKEIASRFSKGMFTVFSIIQKLGSPTIPSILSLIFHFFLGLIKLIGFTITGSVGLLGDGIDSAIDGISAIAVTIAIRIKKEVAITYLLIGLMVLSGVGILFESITRLLNPIALEEENVAISIALVSIILCGFLYFYQRFIGVNTSNLAILAQSEDSKNHVLVGSLVLVAIIANFFELYVLDGVVGCLIGGLILRGSYELWQDVRAASQGEELDLEKYKLGIARGYEKMQTEMLEKWILWRIYKGSNTFTQVEIDFNHDFQSLTMVAEDKKQEVMKRYHTKESLNQHFSRLIGDKLLEYDQNAIRITEKGLKKLKTAERGRRRHKRRRKR